MHGSYILALSSGWRLLSSSVKCTIFHPSPLLETHSSILNMAVSATLLTLLHTYWQYAIPCLCVVYLLSNRYQKGLNRIPGPWLNSFSTLPRMWSVYKGEHHLQDLELHARYGKVVRVAPNLVSVADTNEINQLYGITTKFIKSPFYNLSAVYDEDGLVPDPFVIRNDKTLHSRMKRNAANAYSLNGLIQVEPWVEPVLSRFVGILDDHAQANAICDLGELLKRFAMDAVCSLTFGSDFGYLEKGDDLNFFKSIDLFTAYMSIVSSHRCQCPILTVSVRTCRLASPVPFGKCQGGSICNKRRYFLSGNGSNHSQRIAEISRLSPG